MPDTTFWAWVAGSFGLGWACNSFYQSRTVANGAAQQQGYRTGAAAASDASIGKKARAQSDAFPAIVDNKGPMKLVMCCRQDLNMKKGKIAAQCCHATQGVLETIRNAGAAPHLKMWNTIGRKKVVLKVPGEEELLRIQKHAESVGLPTYIVQDAGRTQIAAGSLTVVAVGPGPEAIVREVTGHLKLM